MTDVTREESLEQVVSEQDFVRLLSEAARSFHQVARELGRRAQRPWSKRHFFLLQTEADELESFLDDYGARTNQAFATATELVASVRGFALAGLSLEHLVRRINGYGVLQRLPAEDRAAAREDLGEARRFVQGVLVELLAALEEQMLGLGVTLPRVTVGDGPEPEPAVRFHLRQDVGQEEIADEEQRIAEVSTKYLQACAMLEEAGFERKQDVEARRELLEEHCSEEQSRVYEATVHNLQSAYDTYVKNTLLEARDERLRMLRGHVSACLHLFEAVTQLMHFAERHESDVRHHEARERLAELVPRDEVNRVTLDLLLHWAARLLREGRPLAEALLPSYTDLQSLEVQLEEGVYLHARPASLIVSIVNQHGTPVEMEVEGETCNAGSILEVMVLVGSHPDARRFAFRGDARPLEDIGRLFEHGLGEQGTESLPRELDYLRGR